VTIVVLRAAQIAVGVIISACIGLTSAQAVTVDATTNARVDFTVVSSTYNFVDVVFNLSGDLFANGDAVAWNIFDNTNSLLGTGGFAHPAVPAIPLPSITVGTNFTPFTGTSFYMVLSAPAGSFNISSVNFLEAACNGSCSPPFGTTQAQTTLTALEATPIPAALPLFASGLGAFGLLRWRRKRSCRTEN
jgi:hypothetical protein